METKQAMIEFITNNFEAILTFIAGGGIVSISKWRSIKKHAEAEAAKQWQDVYQEMIKDLQDDKNAMREENKELRQNLETLRKEVYQISKQVASLRKYKCTVVGCEKRQTE